VFINILWPLHVKRERKEEEEKEKGRGKEKKAGCYWVISEEWSPLHILMKDLYIHNIHKYVLTP
jgi:hypothetical protein